MPEAKQVEHPGKILQREFIDRFGITQYQVAKAIKVPPRRINEIVKGIRSITPDTALRLARYFKTESDYWLDLQARYDLFEIRKKIEDELVTQIRPYEPPQRTNGDND